MDEELEEFLEPEESAGDKNLWIPYTAGLIVILLIVILIVIFFGLLPSPILTP